MENATKALLISGGILIAMLILSIGLFLFATYGDFGASYEQTLEANEIKKFNSNFIKFEGRTDITAQEIITAINLCKEYEVNYGITTNIAISNVSGWSVNKINTQQNGEIAFIKYCNDNNYTFECNIIYDNTTGLINEVRFIRNK